MFLFKKKFHSCRIHRTSVLFPAGRHGHAKKRQSSDEVKVTHTALPSCLFLLQLFPPTQSQPGGICVQLWHCLSAPKQAVKKKKKRPNFSPGWQSQRCCYPNAYNLARRKNALEAELFNYFKGCWPTEAQQTSSWRRQPGCSPKAAGALSAAEAGPQPDPRSRLTPVQVVANSSVPTVARLQTSATLLCLTTDSSHVTITLEKRLDSSFHYLRPLSKKHCREPGVPWARAPHCHHQRQTLRQQHTT